MDKIYWDKIYWDKIYWDKIYIINLEKDEFKKQNSLFQLEKNNITNYEFFKAINSSNNIIYDILYKNIIEDIITNKNEVFIKNNFNKGALGCLLSHIEIIKSAKKNNLQKILILEDDFLMINNFQHELNNLFSNIDDDWDFLYLGKKQGNIKQKIDIVNEIHINNEYFNQPIVINNYVYKPNYYTWGTHAILIKNTIFDDIINFQEKIIAPIDLMLLKLYAKYNFYCVINDLFITDDEIKSSIQINNKNKIVASNFWNWNIRLYNNFNTYLIKNIIVFGFKDSDHTHKHIHNMYYIFFKYYYPYLNVYWFNDEPISNKLLNNSIIFCSPAHVKYMHLPKRSDIFYIIHLDNYDNLGYKTIDDFFNDNSNSIIVNSKNYIILLCREKINKLNYFDKNIGDKTICLTWFSDELYEDIIKIKDNLDNIYNNNNKKKYLSYIGSIWKCNFEIIKNLINICEKNKIPLLLKGRKFNLTNDQYKYINNLNKNTQFILFEPFNHINNEVNSFDYLDKKYGIKGLLPFQGFEHINTFISNRVFETITKGYLIITNNPLTKKYFKSVVYNDNLETLLLEYINILSNKELWKKLMNDQINEFIDKFYGYKIINNLIKFTIETSYLNNKLLILNNYSDENYKIWFTDRTSYSNNFYSTITNNEDIRKAMINKSNYIIYPNENYDIFLIEQLISFSNYNIYLDLKVKNEEFIINICNKYNKNYKIKSPLKIFCLLSEEKNGSTLLTDFLQKTNKKVLSLSEIFYHYNNNFTYNNSYDVKSKLGILYDYEINTIDYYSNISDYFKQFEDIANFKDYEIILFKLTLDYILPIENFTNLDLYLNFIKKFNIVYLERNSLECYVSKKIDDIHCYSNTNYKNIPNPIFDINEYYEYTKNIEIYHKYIFKFIDNYHKINYTSLNNIKNIEKTSIEIFYYFYVKLNKEDFLDLNLFKNYDDYFNKKQNCIDYKELFDSKYWK